MDWCEKKKKQVYLKIISVILKIDLAKTMNRNINGVLILLNQKNFFNFF